MVRWVGGVVALCRGGRRDRRLGHGYPGVGCWDAGRILLHKRDVVDASAMVSRVVRGARAVCRGTVPAARGPQRPWQVDLATGKALIPPSYRIKSYPVAVEVFPVAAEGDVVVLYA